MGRVFTRTGRQEEAVRELETAVNLQPNLLEAHYLLGHTYYRIGEKGKGDKELAKFQQYRAAEYSERQGLLREVQRAVRDQSP